MSKKSRISAVAAVLGVLAAHGWAAAQQSPAPASGASSARAPSDTSRLLQEVTVTAKRAGKLAPRIRAFVNQIVVPENGGDAGLARWQTRPACPLVSGLTRQDGEFILERLSEIARAAGVPLAGQQCRPNLYILVSTEPRSLLRAMQKRNPLFTFGGATPEAIDEFTVTPRAVRAWYRIVEKTPAGSPLMSMSFLMEGRATPRGIAIKGGLPGIDPSLESNPWSQASRLTLNVISEIYRVFVVVDPTRFRGVTRGQLADYVAMVGFARLKASARLGDVPTILKLFDEAPEAAPAGMTDWDQAFLKSLYGTDQESKLQRGEIARAMMREVAH